MYVYIILSYVKSLFLWNVPFQHLLSLMPTFDNSYSYTSIKLKFKKKELMLVFMFLALSSKCKNAICSSIYFSRCHKLWDYLLIQFGDLTFPIQFLKGMQQRLCPGQAKPICCLVGFSPLSALGLYSGG